MLHKQKLNLRNKREENSACFVIQFSEPAGSLDVDAKLFQTACVDGNI